MIRCPIKTDRLLQRDIDDELVVVNLADGEAYLLNEVGAAVLDLSDGHTSLSDIAREIAEATGAALPEVLDHVRQFVADLEQRGLLAEGSDS